MDIENKDELTHHKGFSLGIVGKRSANVEDEQTPNRHGGPSEDLQALADLGSFSFASIGKRHYVGIQEQDEYSDPECIDTDEDEYEDCVEEDSTPSDQNEAQVDQPESILVNPYDQEQLDNLGSFSFGHFGKRGQDKGDTDDKDDLENLRGFSFGHLGKRGQEQGEQDELDNLGSFSFGHLGKQSQDQEDQDLENLRSFSFGHLSKRNQDQDELGNLGSFSFGHMGKRNQDLDDQELENLRSFSFGLLGKRNQDQGKLRNLGSFSFGRLGKRSQDLKDKDNLDKRSVIKSLERIGRGFSFSHFLRKKDNFRHLELHRSINFEDPEHDQPGQKGSKEKDNVGDNPANEDGGEHQHRLQRRQGWTFLNFMKKFFF